VRRGPPGQLIILTFALLALMSGLVAGFLPAPRPELEPEAGSLDCAGLRARVEAWRASTQPPVRLHVRSTALAAAGAADGEGGTLFCGDDIWPASYLVMVDAPGARLPLGGDTTVTVELKRDGLRVLEVCGNCGERGIQKRHVRTPAEVEAGRPLGYALTALSSATLLGLLIWWLVGRRRSADGFVE